MKTRLDLLRRGNAARVAYCQDLGDFVFPGEVIPWNTGRITQPLRFIEVDCFVCPKCAYYTFSGKLTRPKCSAKTPSPRSPQTAGILNRKLGGAVPLPLLVDRCLAPMINIDRLTEGP